MTERLYFSAGNFLSVYIVFLSRIHFYDCDTFDIIRGYKGKKSSGNGVKELVVRVPPKNRFDEPEGILAMLNRNEELNSFVFNHRYKFFVNVFV